MTDEQVNSRLYELMGGCQHERPLGDDWYRQCSKCGKWIHISYKEIDFFTWQGFGILWEWLRKHERWEEFCDSYYDRGDNEIRIGDYWLPVDLISPSALAEAVVEFFEG